MTDYLLEHLTEDMVFVDAGAAYGYYTLLAARRCEQVYAFEPNPAIYEGLAFNVRQNGHRNVRCFNIALDSDLDVGTITLDDFLGGRKVDVVKIDVEGAEADVLLGAQETLTRHGPTLLVEIHHVMVKDFGHTVPELETILWNFGYRWKGLNFEGGLVQIVERLRREHIFQRHFVAWR